jgi:hypothetical protein
MYSEVKADCLLPPIRIIAPLVGSLHIVSEVSTHDSE